MTMKQDTCARTHTHRHPHALTEGKCWQPCVICEIGEENNEVTCEPTPLCYINEVAVCHRGQLQGHTRSRSSCIICPPSFGLAAIQRVKQSSEAGLYQSFIFSLQLTSDPLTTQRWFMTAADRHSQQTTRAVCALGAHVIDYPVSVAFLKCNLSEQHERCETTEKTTPPPSTHTPATTPACIFACIVLAYLCSSLLGNWIPSLPVKLSAGLNRHSVIYCNLAINSSIPPWSSDWCASNCFVLPHCHAITQYISFCLHHNENSSEFNEGYFLGWKTVSEIYGSKNSSEETDLFIQFDQMCD